MSLNDFPTTVQIDGCTLCTLHVNQFEPRAHRTIQQPPLSTLQHDGKFYRVYDELSESQYSVQCGFLSGYASRYWDHPDQFPDLIRPELRFDRRSVKRHLDWGNREPTKYISVYSSVEKARMECLRRCNDPYFQGARRGQVRVSVIKGLEVMQNERVFLTSTQELLRTGLLHIGDEYVSRAEWLVLDRIPASCVEARGTAEQFLEFCDLLFKN
jgi:hypothetical protein